MVPSHQKTSEHLIRTDPGQPQVPRVRSVHASRIKETSLLSLTRYLWIIRRYFCAYNPNLQVKPCASKSLWQQRHAPCHVSAATARWHRLHFLVLAQAATIPSGSRGWIVTMATHLYHEHLQTGHFVIDGY